MTHILRHFFVAYMDDFHIGLLCNLHDDTNSTLLDGKRKRIRI